MYKALNTTDPRLLNTCTVYGKKKHLFFRPLMIHDHIYLSKLSVSTTLSKLSTTITLQYQEKIHEYLIKY